MKSIYLKDENHFENGIPFLQTCSEQEPQENQPTDLNETDEKYTLRIKWINIVKLTVIHITAVYGIYLWLFCAKFSTALFAFFLLIFCGLGITAGAHRLWCHRSYKAKLPLRILLAVANTTAFETDIYEWSRDHRVHHKYSETDADPHNAKRGFFFSHMGWLLCYKHQDVLKKGKSVDMSDVLADPVVQFQRKYYLWLVALLWFAIPTIIPMYFWHETFKNAFYVCVMARYCICLHQTWLVNSAAHMWGTRPYDININPRENLFVIVGAIGEGFHNFHHTFPYDYAASELGFKYNVTTSFLDIMVWLGQAYDCKTASKQMIEMRKQRTGERSLRQNDKSNKDAKTF